jgi:IclR family transcriptional regulator, KDG regulon repressor
MRKAKDSIKAETNPLERFEEKDLELKNTLNNMDQEHPDMVQIHRSAKVIICISHGVNSLSEIADYCKISKSAAHRILKALEKSRFIQYNSFSRKYIIGDLIIGIAAKPNINHEYLRINSNLEMEELATITGETINMTVLSGMGHIGVRTIQSKYDLRVVKGTDIKAFSFNGAISHVLLSQVSDNELEMFLRNIRIEPPAHDSVKDKDDLLTQIKNVKLQGYDISIGERVVGAMCISAPIRNYILPAALNILGPEPRMKERSQSYVKLLLDVSNRISFNLLSILK